MSPILYAFLLGIGMTAMGRFMYWVYTYKNQPTLPQDPEYRHLLSEAHREIDAYLTGEEYTPTPYVPLEKRLCRDPKEAMDRLQKILDDYYILGVTSSSCDIRHTEHGCHDDSKIQKRTPRFHELVNAVTKKE